MVLTDCQRPLADNHRYVTMPTTNQKYIIALLLGIVLGSALTGYYLSKGKQSEPQHSSVSTSGLLSTTRIQAEVKDNPQEEDLVLSQKYTAVVNGEKVSVPIVKRTTGTNYQPTGAGSSNVVQSPQQGVKATVEQTIDLTPVLSKLRPSWELGVGVSYADRRTYVPLSIQRNYSEDKALELTVLVNTDGKAKGAMVQHKWLIK